METRELKLVSVSAESHLAGRASRATAIVLGLVVVACFLFATWLGADEARREIDVREMAERALQTALERGGEDPEVRRTLVELRRTLGWRPLDSKTRVVYASLLLGLSTRLEDMRLAAFHAERAAELSPVTVSVVRAAALVLSHAGEIDRALLLVRRMFGYDPQRAATTLAQINSLVLGVQLDDGIPASADAWLAWSRQLRKEGRGEEAIVWLRRAHERWPEHVPVLLQMARGAYSRQDWSELEELLPPGRELPATPEAAPLHAWRAHLRAHLGDPEGAVADIETALEIPGARGIRIVAGDLFERIGDVKRARHEWNRALHATARGLTGSRRALLTRLARLEDRHGRPADALRIWRAVLEVDPANVEARRRINDLTGFQR